MLDNGQAHLVSLGLTIPTVAMGIHLLIKWREEALKALWEPVKTPTQWLVLGVAVGFLGGTLDNLYWSIPWTIDFISNGGKNPFFGWGVYFNIPFRQLAGIFAAYCHLRSFAEFDHSRRRRELKQLDLVTKIGVSGGILYTWILLLIK